jgi:hypothetical protein
VLVGVPARSAEGFEAGAEFNEAAELDDAAEFVGAAAFGAGAGEFGSGDSVLPLAAGGDGVDAVTDDAAVCGVEDGSRSSIEPYFGSTKNTTAAPTTSAVRTTHGQLRRGGRFCL